MPGQTPDTTRGAGAGGSRSAEAECGVLLVDDRLLGVQLLCAEHFEKFWMVNQVVGWLVAGAMFLSLVVMLWVVTTRRERAKNAARG